MNELNEPKGALYRHSRRGHYNHREADSHVHMCTEENYAILLIDHACCISI